MSEHEQQYERDDEMFSADCSEGYGGPNILQNIVIETISLFFCVQRFTKGGQTDLDVLQYARDLRDALKKVAIVPLASAGAPRDTIGNAPVAFGSQEIRDQWIETVIGDALQGTGVNYALLTGDQKDRLSAFVAEELAATATSGG